MPNSRFEGEYEDPSTQEYSDQGISFAEDEELPEQKHNLKVVSPLGFEPAEALSRLINWMLTLRVFLCFSLTNIQDAVAESVQSILRLTRSESVLR